MNDMTNKPNSGSYDLHGNYPASDLVLQMIVRDMQEIHVELRQLSTKMDELNHRLTEKIASNDRDLVRLNTQAATAGKIAGFIAGAVAGLLVAVANHFLPVG